MATVTSAESVAREIRIRGIVQGVGFRPYVFRLANAHALRGWVLNGGDGVDIHVEGAADALDAFVARSCAHAAAGRTDRRDRGRRRGRSTDVAALRDPRQRRRRRDRRRASRRICRSATTACGRCSIPRIAAIDYPYINCTNCGPRFSIVRALPYDRAKTTMARLADVRRVRRRVSRPGQPALSRAAGRVPRMRPAISFDPDGSGHGRRATCDRLATKRSRRPRRCCAEGADPRGQGHRRLSPRLRRRQRRRRRGAARAQVPQGESRSP